MVFADASSTAARSTAPNQFLVQHADARKPGGGMWIAPADRRTLDGEAKPYSKGLTALKRITPVEFGYSEAAAQSGLLGLGPRSDGRRHVGVVAQELRNVAPEMVLVDKVAPDGSVGVCGHTVLLNAVVSPPSPVQLRVEFYSASYPSTYTLSNRRENTSGRGTRVCV